MIWALVVSYRENIKPLPDEFLVGIQSVHKAYARSVYHTGAANVFILG